MNKPGKMAEQQHIETSPEGGYHIPVLLHETVEQLQIKPDGVYVDCTFGGGGHSSELLKQLGPKGRLIVFDQDADARRNAPDDKRLLFVPQNFRHVHRFLRLHEVSKVDGLMADLGVSSHQFDEAARGFSFRFDAPLDMRMDQRESLTAAKLLQQLTEVELHKMFEWYGEVTNARTLAKLIVEKRGLSGLQSIQDLKNLLQPIVKGNPQKYFAQVFQALRIKVNDELGALEDLLQQLPEVLKPGGRAAFITFHSLEDRLVKQYFKAGTFQVEEDAHDLFGTKKQSPFELVNKKPILPTADEMKKNSRSRSAKLRVAMLK
jgi:16S rRNA (cytosine1402-N4)-methyltransferase